MLEVAFVNGAQATFLELLTLAYLFLAKELGLLLLCFLLEEFEFFFVGEEEVSLVVFFQGLDNVIEVFFLLLLFFQAFGKIKILLFSPLIQDSIDLWALKHLLPLQSPFSFNIQVILFLLPFQFALFLFFLLSPLLNFGFIDVLLLFSRHSDSFRLLKALESLVPILLL